ncbi:MAG: arginine--tRNA ligase, partial [Patescibacteria group bacterium]
MKEQLKILIKRALKSLDLTEEDFVVEHPTDLKMGDYFTNVAIKYGHKEEIVRYIIQNKPDEVEKMELAGPGFINFYLSKDFFKNSLQKIIGEGNEFGKSQHAKDFRVMVEHTQPNPFKQFHIGHLMNNAIGEAISRIIKANGAEVKTVSYHGDIGLHVAKALWKGDYVLGAKMFEEDPEAKMEIQEINKKIYAKSDTDLNTRYEEGKKKSLTDFKTIYDKLGSKFDYNFFESETAELGKKLVLENLGKVFEESEGAVVFKGERFGLHTRVFLNSEGLPTYEAKEIGLARIKKQAFAFNQSITIVGNEQDAFFNVIEAATGEVFPDLKDKLKHISHGMLRLPTGKMSSRTGDVISAETLIEEVKKKLALASPGGVPDEAVAIGAIKYMILRQAIGNDIIFDMDKSVSMEGDSGVYLQYAYARANSLLEKAKDQGLTLSIDSQGQTLR